MCQCASRPTTAELDGGGATSRPSERVLLPQHGDPRKMNWNVFLCQITTCKRYNGHFWWNAAGFIELDVFPVSHGRFVFLALRGFVCSRNAAIGYASYTWKQMFFFYPFPGSCDLGFMDLGSSWKYPYAYIYVYMNS